MSGYPHSPGWKGQDTSRAAAEFVAPSAGRMMDRCEAFIRQNGPSSPEEIAAGMVYPGEHLLLTSVRARVCQLRNLGRVIDAGRELRGIGESGRVKVIRWRVTSADERSMFAARKAAAEEKGEHADG